MRKANSGQARARARCASACALPPLALLLLGSCASTSAAPAALDARADGMKVVARADYAWPLSTLEGDTLRLERFRGRPLFVNLWATWCAPCVAELASIERLLASPAAAGVAVLLVTHEEPERVREFLRRHAYRLPIYVERAPMPEAFGLRALPTTFIVTAEGDVVVRHRGAARWDRPAVEALLRFLVEHSSSEDEEVR